MANEGQTLIGPNQFASPEVLFENAQKSLGLQTYEFFEGEGEHRTAERQAFLRGETRNPDLGYPLLNPAVLHDHEVNLTHLINTVNGMSTDSDLDMSYWLAIGYRLGEVYFLREAVRLNEATDPTDRAVSARRFNVLGAELYGRPEKDVFDAAVSEIWRQIDNKDYDEVGQTIKADLDGFLIRMETEATIPILTPEAVE